MNETKYVWAMQLVFENCIITDQIAGTYDQANDRLNERINREKKRNNKIIASSLTRQCEVPMPEKQ